MATFITVLHLFVCVILVLVVLVQSGKDGGIGVMGGGGSSQTVFGSSGGANFFTRFTSVLAGIFMVTSVLLTVTKDAQKGSVFATPAGADHAIPPVNTGAPASTTTAPQAAKEAPSAPAAPAKSPSNSKPTDKK